MNVKTLGHTLVNTLSTSQIISVGCAKSVIRNASVVRTMPRGYVTRRQMFRALRGNNGPSRVARFLHSAVSTPGAATTVFGMIRAVDDADLEVEGSAATTTPQCEPGSKALSCRAWLTLVNNEDGAGNIGALFHCMLVHNPDNDFTADANTYLYNSDDSPAAREIRAHTFWKKAIWVPSLNSTGGNVRETPINIKFKKFSQLDEDDRIELWVYHGNTDAASVSLQGQLYYKEK